MRHIKLESCESTQLYLKQQLESSSVNLPVLVSTLRQTKGIGRDKNTWDNLPNALAFSFAFEAPNPILVPIQMGAFLSQWLQQHHDVNVQVKWPNDLFFHGKKIGGVICHLVGKSTAIVGVGINWGDSKHQSSWTTLFPKKQLSADDQHQLPFIMVRDFLALEQTPADIVEQWTTECCHLKTQVTLEDEKGMHTGIFQGINSHGMARISIDGIENTFINGHLTVLDKPSSQPL